MELQVFVSPKFGRVRTVEINHEPWLVGKDVAEALGYTDTFGALKKHVDAEDKQNCQNDSFESPRGMVVINESGLYSLVFGSKLKEAKEFKHWVTSEVLPSLRKNGGYIAGQENMTDDELMASALLVAKRKIEERDKQIEHLSGKLAEAAPKIVFADAVASSHSSILIGELAKILRQNGVEMGQKRLFAWLRENGYLIKSGSSRNTPTQRSMELGLFSIKEGSYVDSNGVNVITKTTKVTGKGQLYFINKFRGFTYEGSNNQGVHEGV